MSSIEVGQPAPAFDMPTDSGNNIRLADLSGQIVVLYFYPKDDTPGCTTEAIAFTGLSKPFADAGATVIGVSMDTVEKHCKFRDKHSLSVILASDPKHEVISGYGSWVEKSMYGKTYMGIDRSTFVIGRDGKFAHIWRKVKVKGHAEAVLDAVRAL